DDEAVGVRGAVRPGSLGVRVCGADCNAGAGGAMVSRAARPSDGNRVLRTGVRRCSRSAASELSDPYAWMAACFGNRGGGIDGGFVPGGNLGDAIDSRRVRLATGR